MTKEEEIDGIVREYLELNGLEVTLAAFDSELEKQGKRERLIQNSGPSVAERVQRTKSELVVFFEQGRRQEFFELWEESIPTSIRDLDTSCQHLEFYLQIHFAVFALRRSDSKSDSVDDNISQYKLFLETRGAQLSQTSEFLPFYALPFIPSPKDHPSFQDIFQDSWVTELCKRLESFLDTAVKAGLRSRLSELVSWENTAQHQLHQAFHRIAEMTHKLAAHQHRFRKVQEDYHKLMGLASELIGSLELAVRGELSDIDPIMNLCAQSFPEIFGRNHRGGSEENSLYSTSESSISIETELHPLNFEKISRDLASGQPHQKALLLQALRWRLTQTRSNSQRAEVLASYITADLLGCSQPGNRRRAMLNLLSSPVEEVKQSISRLLNGYASFREGRLYLSQCPELVSGLLDNLTKRKVSGVTQDMTLATLQKLSLRRHHQTTMIEGNIIEWLLTVLEDHDSLSDYSLEYAVALFMNLCLRASGKVRCTSNPRRVLAVLTDLLGNQNQEIIPYVNGALYSVLSVAAVRKEAQAMAMEDILRCFIQEGSSEMRRQLEFILKQLTTENADDQASDEDDEEDDDDDDEENQDILEEDLDRDDCVVISPEDFTGELLFNNLYMQFPINGVIKQKSEKKRPPSSRTEVLTRPSTPRVPRPTGDVYSAPISNGTYELKDRLPPAASSAPLPERPRTREVKRTRAVSQPVASQDETREQKPDSTDSETNRPTTGPTVPQTPNYGVDVAASEIVTKLTGMKKALAEAVNNPTPPKTAAPANEYAVAFSTRPKIPRTPEAGGRANSRSPADDFLEEHESAEPATPKCPVQPSSTRTARSMSRRIVKA